MKSESFNEEFIDEVEREIRKIENPKNSSLNNIIILTISIFIFATMGLFSQSVADILILILVIFIHEMGHVLAMKLLKYKNVSMLFIPFFGALVSGLPQKPSSIKAAIVDMAGPLPGIIIATIILIINNEMKNHLLSQYIVTSLFINIFNLLPISPLDGGRFLNDILLSRNYILELLFNIFGALTLFLLSFYLDAIGLRIFAVFIFINISVLYKQYKIYKYIKKTDLYEKYMRSESLTRNFIVDSISVVVKQIPSNSQKANNIVTHIHSVWTKIVTVKPSVLTSIGGVFIYFIIILISLFLVFTSFI